MDYLIIIYEESEVVKTLLMNESEMFQFIQDNVNKVKFTVNKVECVLDLS